LRLRAYILPLLPIAGFFVLWQFLSDARVINPGLFSAPLTVMEDLRDLLQQQSDGRSVLVGHLMTTLKRLALAALCGTLAGALAGIGMGLSRTVHRFFDPLIALIMPIPGIAMAPLFIVWLGFGDPTIIAIGAIATFFPVAYNTSAGIRSVDRQLIRAARIMGTGPLPMLLNVYLPWSSVHLFIGFKLGLARCWRTVIAVELVASASWGLGYMVWDAAEHLNAGVVYGGILIMAILFTVIEKGLVGPLEKMTIEKWGMVRA
jgi:ABC-type nitrate/sulfonate/bicarbonate transport system permease component